MLAEISAIPHCAGPTALKMSYFLVLALLRAVVTHCAPADVIDRDCTTKFGDYAWYNETLEKCVIPFSADCDEAWPSDEYVCGPRGDGECREGWCTCPKDLHLWLHNRDLGTEAFPDDFSCVSLTGYGESCLEDRGYIPGTCQKFLSCSGGTCVCDGHWNETDRICRGDEFCSLELQTDSSRDAFYETSTGLCKCKISSNSCLKNGHESPSLCPVNATIKQSGNGWTCECNEGHEIAQDGDDNSSPTAPTIS